MPSPIVFASVRKNLKTGELREILPGWFVQSVRKRLKANEFVCPPRFWHGDVSTAGFSKNGRTRASRVPTTLLLYLTCQVD
ncbi:MAG: hypothetical protein NVS9B14_02410 [Candidatus Acidiferrum sp.]